MPKTNPEPSATEKTSEEQPPKVTEKKAAITPLPLNGKYQVVIAPLMLGSKKLNQGEVFDIEESAAQQLLEQGIIEAIAKDKG